MTNTTKRALLIVAISGAVIAGVLIARNPRHDSQADQQDGQTFNEQLQIDKSTVPKYQTDKPVKGDQVAIIKTSSGAIEVKLLGKKVPEMVNNFQKLSEQGKYNGVIFHRVIKDFMIQTGDFQNSDGTGGYSYKGPGTSIPDQFSDFRHIKGAVSMANTGPDTNGSQFFIVSASSGTPWLDGKHAIFGQVYGGIDVVDKISNVKVEASQDPTQPGSKPVDPPKINSIEIKTL